METIISSQIVKSLVLPKPSSHKRDNGTLLIIAGADQKYFGALLYSVTAASRLVDLVYLLEAPANQKLIAKLRLKTGEFMPLLRFPNKKLLDEIDCILIGPGMGQTSKTKRLVYDTLNSGKKAVLDADSLNVIDEKLKKLLTPLCILTPHKREFIRLFNMSADKNDLLPALKGGVSFCVMQTGMLSLVRIAWLSGASLSFPAIQYTF
jgi:ADP-dependent NAD(P)H-hydrate dehydratase / NAD(P)H-hydrate epimerase